MPLVVLVPGSRCPHGEEIRAGWCCVVCHRSGSDGHPDLVISRGERPELDKKPAPLIEHLTRKQSRRLRFEKDHVCPKS